MEALETHDVKGRLADNRDGTFRDEWAYRKPLLKDFMQKCIDYCISNGKKSIKIGFY